MISIRVLKGKWEMLYAIQFLACAAREAENSTCLRKKCGAVVVKDGKVIGKGFNSPPGDVVPSKCIKNDLLVDFKSDRTCCVHAEQRAIMDALRHYPEEIEGSTLYFTILDNEGTMAKSGRPYCTICSKMALDVKIGRFVLWHKKGITVYKTDEYNRISFGLEE